MPKARLFLVPKRKPVEKLKPKPEPATEPEPWTPKPWMNVKLRRYEDYEEVLLAMFKGDSMRVADTWNEAITLKSLRMAWLLNDALERYKRNKLANKVAKEA